MREFIIVAFSLLGIFIFIILWIWRVVFRKSLRKLVMTMLAILQDRDMLVDPDAEILPSQEIYASDVMEAKAESLKQDFRFPSQQSLPQAHITEEDTSEWVRDTTDSGWPRELDYETRHEKRPFRDVHLRTSTGQTHEIMDADTYTPPDDAVDTEE